ncbi:hypothetical protein LTR37_008598 [Vermiconidia calcicola]|uniref:Uncharacterized protein n=1 Tax=Vermiconidia calcicola TaxID=1690605 RepID=A0ACC3N9W6_9PEZI|nr:hypothetical protein LTR37_008598 [Vermiconidia calcicola]
MQGSTSRARLSMRTAIAALAVTSFFVSTLNAAVDPIVVKGAKFFTKDGGAQFFIKGVAYQLTVTGASDANAYIDPLADGVACQRDIPYIQRLGMNAVRVYAVDPTLNHDDCMNGFAEAGIYVLADLTAPGAAIRSDRPTWDADLYDRFTSVVDALQGFTNTMAFFAGNQVVDEASNADVAPVVKAAIRDMKRYISAKGHRRIPVGYASNDNSVSDTMARYLNCGDQADALDFFGLTVFSWCGDSSFEQSGYDQLTQQFTSYSIPSFFAEYGCNLFDREFEEVATLYGPEMSPVLSGGVLWAYFEEGEDYGLVEVSGASVSELRDFDNLESQIEIVIPSTGSIGAYLPSNSPASCPTQDASWSATTALPPPPSKAVVDFATLSTDAVSPNTTGTSTPSPGASNVPSSAAPDSRGLPTGAKAGIGVGVGVVVLIAAVIATLVWRKRRKTLTSGTIDSNQDAVEKDPAVMLGNDNAIHELEQPRAEMSTGWEAQELPHGHGNSELGRSVSKGPKGLESRHEM